MRSACLWFALLLVAVVVNPAPAAPKNAAAKKKAAEQAKKQAPAKKKQPATFHGMIVEMSGGNVTLKHANGGWKTFDVANTPISGLGGTVKGVGDLRKGQVVNVHHIGKQAKKVEVVQQAEADPKLVGKKKHYEGIVEKVVSDPFGDNGKVWVKGSKGVKEFAVHNETIINNKPGGKSMTHTLQGVGKGMTVRITHQGNQATHIEFIRK